MTIGNEQKIESEKHGFVVEYFAEGSGRETVASASVEIYQTSGTYQELYARWKNFFDNTGKDAGIVEDNELGFIVTFPDNPDMGLIIPRNFEFGGILRSGNYESDRQRGEIDPFALPIITQLAIAEKQSGKWLRKQKGRLTHK